MNSQRIIPERYTEVNQRNIQREIPNRNIPKWIIPKKEYTPMMYRSEFPEDYNREDYIEVNPKTRIIPLPKRNTPT